MNPEPLSIDDLPQQIWFIKSPLTYGLVNKAHADFLGLEVSELSYRNIHDVLPKNEADECFRNNVRVFESRKTEQSYEWVTGSDGSPRYFSISKSPKFNSEGEIAHLVCTAFDITEQKQTEEYLKSVEDRYRIIVENTSDTIVVLSKSGELLYYSKPQHNILGYEGDEIIGIPFNQFLPSQELCVVQSKFKQVLKNIEVEKFESKLLHKNGEEIDVKLVARVIEFEGETTVHCTISDISERKQAEKEMQYQLELRRMLMYMASMFLNTPISKTKEMINYSLKKLGELVGADRSYVFDYNHEKEIAINTGEYCKANIEPQIDNLQAVPFSGFSEWLPQHKKGQSIEIYDVTKYPAPGTRAILEPQGVKSLLSVPLMHGDTCKGMIGFDFVTSHHVFTEDEKGMVGVFAEMIVSMQRRFEADYDNARLLMAIEQTPASIIITNNVGLIIYVNPFAASASGFSREELISQPYTLLGLQVEDEKDREELWANIHAGKVWRGEFFSRRKDNEIIWEKAVLAPIMNENGDTSDCIIIKLDTTERKKMFVEFERAKEKAEESERLKTAFLANMSHEIRSPLNGVIGFASILTEDPHMPAEDIRRYTQIINNSGNHLLNIINDIINISKLDSGQIKSVYEPTSINYLLKELYQLYSKQIKDTQKPLQLSMEVLAGPMIVSTDPTRLRQILENLLSNALKFTAEGNISYGYSVKGDYLEFFVQDTGVGIEADKHEHIFGRFVQASVHTEKLYGGTGLGLSIAKACVQLLGGDIWVESRLNEGCTFYFTIKYNPCKSEE